MNFCASFKSSSPYEVNIMHGELACAGESPRTHSAVQEIENQKSKIVNP